MGRLLYTIAMAQEIAFEDIKIENDPRNVTRNLRQTDADAEAFWDNQSTFSSLVANIFKLRKRTDSTSIF